jgi:hypothetical protein
MADASNQSDDAYHVDGVSNNESNTDVVAIHADGGDQSTTNDLVVTGTAIAIVEDPCDGSSVGSAYVGNGCCAEDGNMGCTELVENNVVIIPASPDIPSESNTDKIMELAQPLFKKLVVDVKQRMTGSSISLTTVTIILKYAMEVVELSEVKGAEQKELALDIVRQIIIDAPLSETAETACMLIVDSGILVGVVDLVVDATKGRLSINQVKKRGKSCLRGLGCMKA